MRVDPDTLLFHDFTPEEATEMQEWAESLLLGGCPPNYLEKHFVHLWMAAGGFDDDQKFLTAPTVLAARILLSLLRYHQENSFAEVLREVVNGEEHHDV